MEFGDSLRAAEDKERWKDTVATPSVRGPLKTVTVKGLR